MTGSAALGDVLDWARDGKIAPPPGLPVDPDKDRLARRMAACQRDYPDIFELIFDMTVRRPPVDYSLPREQGYDYALLREGQNQVAAGLADYLVHAERISHGNRSPTAGRPVPADGPRPDAGPAEPEPAEPWDDSGPFAAV